MENNTIEIKKTTKRYHTCKTCGKEGAEYELVFRDELYCGTCVTLCKDCLKKLRDKIDVILVVDSDASKDD